MSAADLLIRLEIATEGSGELDAEVAAYLAGATPERQPDGRTAYHRDGHWVSIRPILPVTRSVDAAMTLVPAPTAALRYSTVVWGPGAPPSFKTPGAKVLTYRPDPDAEGGWSIGGMPEVHAATPALSLTIAVIKVREYLR